MFSCALCSAVFNAVSMITQAANQEQLQQLAIFGTSMRSLSDTTALFEALVGGSSLEQPMSRAAARSPAAGVCDVQDAQAAALQPGGRPGAAADIVSTAYQQGRVLEVPCPDCAAHGVGASLHLFRAQQQQA